MCALFSTFISVYGSLKNIEIDKDLTEFIESCIDCLVFIERSL